MLKAVSLSLPLLACLLAGCSSTPTASGESSLEKKMIAPSTLCAQCSKQVTADKVKQVNGGLYCEDCAAEVEEAASGETPEGTTVCVTCGTTMMSADAKTVEGKAYCIACDPSDTATDDSESEVESVSSES